MGTLLYGQHHGGDPDLAAVRKWTAALDDLGHAVRPWVYHAFALDSEPGRTCLAVASRSGCNTDSDAWTYTNANPESYSNSVANPFTCAKRYTNRDGCGERHTNIDADADQRLRRRSIFRRACVFRPVTMSGIGGFIITGTRAETCSSAGDRSIVRRGRGSRCTSRSGVGIAWNRRLCDDQLTIIGETIRPRKRRSSPRAFRRPMISKQRLMRPWIRERIPQLSEERTRLPGVALVEVYDLGLATQGNWLISARGPLSKPVTTLSSPDLFWEAVVETTGSSCAESVRA